jgi:hypothetical protein
MAEALWIISSLITGFAQESADAGVTQTVSMASVAAPAQKKIFFMGLTP